MRTKALLCAAAMAAGAATSMAQTSNVYSLNVVGYVNFYLTEGFNLVANHMDLDGTGTNNYSFNVFTNLLPVGSTIYTFKPDGSGYNSTTYGSNPITHVVKWSGTAPGPAVNPGQALWVSVPNGAFGGTTQPCVTVGNVLTGALVNAYIPGAQGGFGFVGNQLPIGGGLVSNLSYAPHVGDTVYTFKQDQSGYNSTTYGSNPITHVVKWSGTGEPVIGVGQGFWLQTGTAGTVWSNYFTVQ